jgi:hypothetical protein
MPLNKRFEYIEDFTIIIKKHPSMGMFVKDLNILKTWVIFKKTFIHVVWIFMWSLVGCPCVATVYNNTHVNYLQKIFKNFY